jgi:hypothetical protein
MDWQRLSLCQSDAAAGRFAQALSGFLKWLAPRYSEVRAGLRAEMATLRQEASSSHQHRRTPGIVADLGLGLRYFLHFTEACGAIDTVQARELWARGWQALAEAGAGQRSQHTASEPARRFLDLLQAALASGSAHIADPNGCAPQLPSSAIACGWREHSGGAGEYAWMDLRPLGRCIGWVDGQDVYLEPTAALQVAQQIARDIGDNLAITGHTLHKRLNEQGLLASTEPVRGTLTARRTLAGGRKSVLHLRTVALLPQEADQVDQSSDAEREMTRSASPLSPTGQGLWSGVGQRDARTDREIRPDRHHIRVARTVDGQDGRVGQVSQTAMAATDRQELEDTGGDWEEVP